MMERIGLMLTNVQHYLNIGLVMLIVGFVLIIIGLVMLWRYLNRSWEVSMAELNYSFLQDTGKHFSDVRLTRARQEAARRNRVREVAEAATGEEAGASTRSTVSGIKVEKSEITERL